MNNQLKEYYEALERLKTMKTKILQRGALITFDNVALEAGRTKGSIKANRDVYRNLRIEITKAKEAQTSPDKSMENQVKKLTAEKQMYKTLYEQALVREISLYRHFMELNTRLLAESEAKNKNKLIPIFRKANGVNNLPNGENT